MLLNVIVAYLLLLVTLLASEFRKWKEVLKWNWQ